MMVALEPVRQKWGLDRIIVSTYQAVSGAGMGAILETQRELREVLNDGVKPRDLHAEILPSGGDKKHYPIAFNALPQIDVFTDNDYTYEEMKMTKETKKIMEDDSIAVSATCVRIPVLSAHSESVYIETKEVAPIEEVKAAISAFPGAVLEDDVAHQIYPQAINAVGSRDTFVVVRNIASPAAKPPNSATSLTNSIESRVSLVPTPAIKGTRPLTIFCTAANSLQFFIVSQKLDSQLSSLRENSSV